MARERNETKQLLDESLSEIKTTIKEFSFKKGLDLEQELEEKTSKCRALEKENDQLKGSQDRNNELLEKAQDNLTQLQLTLASTKSELNSTKEKLKTSQELVLETRASLKRSNQKNKKLYDSNIALRSRKVRLGSKAHSGNSTTVPSVRTSERTSTENRHQEDIEQLTHELTALKKRVRVVKKGVL